MSILTNYWLGLGQTKGLKQEYLQVCSGSGYNYSQRLRMNYKQ